jgi:hypothetical protein
MANLRQRVAGQVGVDLLGIELEQIAGKAL